MNSLSVFRKPPCNRTMGIEIEGYIYKDDPRPARDLHEGFWYVTTDGSISSPSWDHYDFEFVSQPLPPTWLKREIGKLYKKYKIEANHSCGIHIHVSRKWLTEKKAKAIYTFLENHQEYCHEWFGRDRNEYCRFDGWGMTRYNAVNNDPTKTIEFRMFSSGSSVSWAQYCVDCVEYLINNAYRLNVDAMNAFRDTYRF